MQIQRLADGDNTPPSSHATTRTCLSFIAPLCAQSILLLRIFNIYPAMNLTRASQMVVYIPLLGMKLARVSNAAFNIVMIAQHRDTGLAWTSANAKVEWILQFLDDL